MLLFLIRDWIQWEITNFSRERAGEEFPDFTGDENMWFSSYKMREYKYFMSFSEGKLHSFYAEKNYDVDWSSGE